MKVQSILCPFGHQGLEVLSSKGLVWNMEIPSAGRGIQCERTGLGFLEAGRGAMAGGGEFPRWRLLQPRDFRQKSGRRQSPSAALLRDWLHKFKPRSAQVCHMTAADQPTKSRGGLLGDLETPSPRGETPFSAF